jgi:DNA-binding NarL/FixJ family response regulator
MKALGLVRDLIFRSKIDGVAEACGVEIGYASELARVAERCASMAPALIIVDLSDKSFDPRETMAMVSAAAPKAQVIGFASHVDVSRFKAAREAGFTRVLSRQEFVAKLPALFNQG